MSTRLSGTNDRHIADRRRVCADDVFPKPNYFRETFKNVNSKVELQPPCG